VSGAHRQSSDSIAAIGRQVTPASAIATRKVRTQALQPRFQEVGEMLRSMDKLILRFRSTDAGCAFADAWTAARTIRDLGRRSPGTDTDEPAAAPAPSSAS
jgi:hypothetical protein